MVFVAFSGLDIDLCRQVAARVYLIIHIERRVLRIAQILLRVRLINAARNRLRIVAFGPHLLAFVSVNDGRAGILAERKLALSRDFSITQESQCDILVVVGSLGIVERFSHLLVVLAAEHNGYISKSVANEGGQTFGRYFEHRFAFKLAYADVVFGE